MTGLAFAHALAAPAIAAPTYFLVAEPQGVQAHGDSFVLPLEQPADITHARDLIARGRDAGAPIVFAEIVKSGEARNRNLLSPDQHAWSWHVSRFEGFGDFGIELLDGWPTYVEQNLDEWIRATGEVVDPKRGTSGNIGFWNYTVVAELRDYSPTLPPMASIPLPGALGTGLLTIGLAGIGYATMKRRWRREH